MKIESTHRFCTNEAFFGSIKPKAASWFAANTIFKARDALPLNERESATWKQITGLDYVPKVRRNWLYLCGRRSGKDVNAARLALMAALSDDHKPFVAPGEKVFVLVISLNMRSNRVFLDYVRGFIKGSRILSNEVIRETEHEIHLKNNVIVAGYPCSNAAPRGLTCKKVILDEPAFMRQTGVVTDTEIFRAVRPCMASIPNASFDLLTTPWVKQGLVFDLWGLYFGKENDFITVVQAPSIVMNPTIPAEFLAQEQEADPEAYRREFLAEWTDSTTCLLQPEALRACVAEGVSEIPPSPAVRHFAFFDGASGGAGGDSGALGISRLLPDGTAELVCLREWVPPFSPSGVVEECAHVLRTYSLSEVTSDLYSPGWCKEAFTRCGIRFTASDKSKSEIYRETIGPINSNKIRLLDNKKLIGQFASLERRVARGSGFESIDHPRGVSQHDDLANAASGCLRLALAPQDTFVEFDVFTGEVVRKWVGGKLTIDNRPSDFHRPLDWKQ